MERSSKMVHSSVDRISELPIEMKIHILSFLTTNSAIRMGSVSKAWAGLWYYSSHLFFDLAEFPQGDNNQPPSETRFVNFVDRVLAIRSGNGDDIGTIIPSRFLVRWHRDFDMVKATTWLNYVTDHKVRELMLGIAVPAGTLVVFPENLFRCSSLVRLTLLALDAATLRIHLRTVLIPPKSMDFSILKKLILDGMTIDLLFLGILVSNSPALEELRVSVEGVATVRASAPNLKKLFLVCMAERGSEIHIPMPKLDEFVCFFGPNVPKMDLGVIRSPTLGFIACSRIADGNGDNLCRILATLVNVRCLVLWRFTIKSLSFMPDLSKHIPSPFCGVKNLSLEMMLDKDSIRFVTILLGSFPNLEVLKLRNFEVSNIQLELSGVEDVSFPPNLDKNWRFHDLKTIIIQGFCGSKDELELIKFLMKRASTLQKLILYCKKELQNHETWTEISVNLHDIPRASQSAKIVLNPALN